MPCANKKKLDETMAGLKHTTETTEQPYTRGRHLEIVKSTFNPRSEFQHI
jgi:hypothetical protein